ncbi:hypothetical protein U1Q18_009482 [Sarracenia purpurea var. burkii]
MPSGSKKRKAAKKRKEKEANTNSTTRSHVREEKESDGGDSSSPESQGHSFTEGEGEEEMEKREDASYVRSIVTENEPVAGANCNGESKQKVAIEESNFIQTDKEFKPKDSSDSENVRIEHIEPMNSGSSSDDESRVIEKNIVVIESGESKEDSEYSVAETAAFADPVKTTDLPEATQITNGVPVVDAYNLVAGEPKEEACDPVSANSLSVNLVKLNDLPEITQVTNGVPVIEAYTLAEGKSMEEEASSLVAETIPLDSENVRKNAVHVKDSEPIEKENGSVIELGSNENGKNEGSDDNSVVSSVAAGFAAQEDEYKLMPSSIVPSVDNSNSAENIKDSIVTECSDRQPLVASTPRPVQTTSWKSCCGLFEVFTGSNS